MAHAVAEVQRVDGRRSTSTTRPGAARRRGHLPAHPDHAHPWGASRSRAPASVSSSAGFGPRSFGGPRHRHLAVPARPGEVGHDRPLPLGPQRGGGGPTTSIRAHPGAAGDRGGGRLPRAGAPDRRRDHRVSLAYADEVRRALGSPDGQRRSRLVAARGPGPGAGRCGGRADLGGAQGLRVVRLLQGSTRPPSPCPPTSRPGSRPIIRRPSSPECSPTTRGCTPSGSSSTTPARWGSPFSAWTSTPRPGSTALSGSPRPTGSCTRGRTRTCRRQRVRHPALLADVKGISGCRGRLDRGGAPYAGLADFVARAQVSVPVTERLILAGGFDSVYGIEPLPTAAGFAPRRPASAPASARPAGT